MVCIRDDARVHLIAICGTAMGCLAGLLRGRGCRVTGSDARVYPPMSEFLRAEGIEVRVGFDPDILEPRPDLVVVGNAVSRGNPELEATLDRGIPYASLPEVLRDLFLAGRRPLVVTGTHGKTTTTALVAHLLRAGGLDPSWLVAGIPRDLPRPYGVGGGDWFAVEGDEYDSAYFAKFAKFLFYRPHLLIVNNIEFDHADIYRDLDEIRRAFRQVVNQVPRAGLVLVGGDDPVAVEAAAGSHAPVETFGLGEGNTWRAVEVCARGPEQSFDLVRDGRRLGRLRLGLAGEHNLRNALAALAAAAFAGLEAAALAAPLGAFTGVRRRQESLGTAGGVALVDDFAHHPTAVAQTLAGLRVARPGGRLWVAFEPASATNARATFEDRYVDAFAQADGVVLAPVPRPERSRGEPPFSPERLAARLRESGRAAWSLADAEAIAAHLAACTAAGDTIVFMSNGGFGGVQERTRRRLEARDG